MFFLLFTAAWLLTLGAVGAITDRWANGAFEPASSARRDHGTIHARLRKA